MSHQGDAAGDSVEIGGVTLGTDTRQLDPGATEPSAVDLARYTAARVAADDPELVLGPLTDAFGDLYCLVRVGDRLAACGAAIKVQNLSLQACVTPAASAEAADDKIRALAIVLGWAWSRVPALAAVLKAAMAQEGERWGGDVSGRA